jgi:hypothetical protein
MNAHPERRGVGHVIRADRRTWHRPPTHPRGTKRPHRTTDRALPAFIGARALSARSVGSRRAAGSPGLRSEAGAHGHNRAQKSRLARSPWSPEHSVQTLCRGAEPASTSGFTGTSSRLEPRPSPSHGDALQGLWAVPTCPLTWAFERTTGFEPATLTLPIRRPGCGGVSAGTSGLLRWGTCCAECHPARPVESSSWPRVGQPRATRLVVAARLATIAKW